jgi:hypothetical protein
MKPHEAEHREGGEIDGRLEALVDEALREVLPAQPVDLKPRVMAAWDERARRPVSGRVPVAAVSRWWMAPLLLRPAAVFAALLVLVAATLLVWQARRPRPVDPPVRTQATPAAVPAPGAAAPLDQPPSGALARESAPRHDEARARAAGRAARGRLVEVEFAIEQIAANLGNLPGAPAREPGEGLAPLPGTSSNPMTPIEQAPTVSDMSRPVSDFPAGESSQPPGAEHGDPGQSGGPRR